MKKTLYFLAIISLFIILNFVQSTYSLILIYLLTGFTIYKIARFLIGQKNRRVKKIIRVGSCLVLLIFVSAIVIGATYSNIHAAENSEQISKTGQVDLQEIKTQESKTSIINRIISFCGIIVLIFIAYLLSAKRKDISWRPVIWGVILQMVFGIIVLSPQAGDFFFNVVDSGVKKLLYFSEEGAAFVFQATQPHTVKTLNFANGKIEDVFVPGPGHEFHNKISPVMKNFAFWVLPTIIFFSSLMTVLYHSGIMTWIIKFFAWIMQKTMGTSGSESLSAAANIFVGQTEAPLVVKPFVKTMTNSELHAVMVGGFATVAGGVMAAYVSFLKDFIPGIAGHLVTASIMSAPAALAVSKVMFPETEESITRGKLKTQIPKKDANVIEAAARGASEGMTLALNVAAMLVAFVGLVALINFILGTVGLSLQKLLGWVFAPIAWTMGVPWSECKVTGLLLGEKLVLTEFLAYLHLGDIMRNGYKLASGEIVHLSQRTAIIASYALCGFANFASIGIQIGGIGGIAPSRRGDLAKLGLRAMAGGAIAACMTGTIAGILL